MKQFNLYLDEDKIIRCKGRINNADTTKESKNPVLLPSQHRYTKLLIRERHDHVHHNSVRKTLNAIREAHWVLKGKEAVKRVIRKCTYAEHMSGKSALVDVKKISRYLANEPLGGVVSGRDSCVV